MTEKTSSGLTRAELPGLSGMYRLLSRCWLREADRAMLQWLGLSGIRQPFLEAGGWLPTLLDDTLLDDTLLDALAVDYCRLFLGPRDHLPPYQSVWQHGQLQGAPAASVRRFIDAVGYPVDDRSSALMRDHLAVQLDVMGYLCGQAATVADDPNQYPQCVDLAGTFFARHLTWTHALLEAAEKRAETAFYQSLAGLTRRFLVSERAAWLGEST